MKPDKSLAPECLNCGNSKIESNGLCATCAHEMRKALRMQVKEKKPINKVSEKRKPQLKEYAALREKFLLNKWCAYHGRPCIPSQVHHQMGRVGFADEKEIPLLLDVRYWIPVCNDAHEWITQNSKAAIDLGYSFSRLATNTK